MKRSVLFSIAILIAVFAAGCDSNNDSGPKLTEEHEGIIARITESEDTSDDEEFQYRMLVISDVDMNDIEGKSVLFRNE